MRLPNNNDVSSWLIGPLIKPVFTIQPYSATEGYFFFGPTTFIPAEKVKVKLLVRTTRKTFTRKIHITVDRFNEAWFKLQN